MGRRKIEIKAIKDDRNRAVTFLKRKGGLFKKAHELSVLCSVDVAVFIFGSNKKLYEYSSGDMRELVTRYTYHGVPQEHKGPSDFNGGADDGSDEEGDNSPPQGMDNMENHMLPPNYPGQAPYPHLNDMVRHHTPSASPPIPNGVFAQHPQMARGHTPQPHGSRPGSRNDMRRMNPGMQQQGQGPPHGVNGFAFMPVPAIYNPQNAQSMPPSMPPLMAQGAPQFPYPPPQVHPPHMQAYVEEQRRPSLPPNPNFPPQGPAPSAPMQRHSVSPPQPHPQQLPQHQIPRSSPPAPHHQPLSSPPLPNPVINEPPPMVKVERMESIQERQSQPPLGLSTEIKKMSQRKQPSIFTPIEENGSILGKHFQSFHGPKSEARSQSVDATSTARGSGSSPPSVKRPDVPPLPKPRHSVPTIPETTFTPPSRANSLRIGGAARPRLRVEIPDEPSDGASATAESSSPKGMSDTTSQSTRRNTDSHASSMVLPPPSPSASALLSAGATGPPNPFARPPPSNHSMDINTPASALPSRFMTGEYLPSPSSFYPEWNFGTRGDSNTMASPLNFATPVVGTGPSFLRDDNSLSSKRKSPEMGATGHSSDHLEVSDAKRLRVDS